MVENIALTILWCHIFPDIATKLLCQHSLIKQVYLDNIFTRTFHRTEKSAVQNRLLVKDMVTWGKWDSLTPNNMAVKMQLRSRWMTMEEAMLGSQSLLILVTDTLSIRARFDKVTQEAASWVRQAGDGCVHGKRIIWNGWLMATVNESYWFT